jgi:hypothetical protein
MPAKVLKCVVCGGYQSFLVHEDELLELKNNKPIVRNCPPCRRTTDWVVVSPDWRGGHERRSGPGPPGTRIEKDCLSSADVILNGSSGGIPNKG